MLAPVKKLSVDKNINFHEGIHEMMNMLWQAELSVTTTSRTFCGKPVSLFL